MGILKNIFKSLWGQEDEPAAKPAEPAAKPVESAKTPPAASPQYPAGNQSFSSKPAETPTKTEPPRVEPKVEVKVEPKPELRPVEASVRTSPSQSAPAPLPPEPVAELPRPVPSTPSFPAHKVAEESFNHTGGSAVNLFEQSPPPVATSPVAEVTAAKQAKPELVQTATAATATVGSPSTELNFFDEVVDDFDEAFDAAFSAGALQESNESVGAGDVQHDEAAIQDLFANIAANYAKPVKNFVFELKRGTATKEWIEICRPAMRSISRAAESMELTLAAKRMVDFDEALSLAQTSEHRVLDGEIRDLILSSYEELIEVLPQTFLIGEEEQQREGIIINSLLKQIPDLGRVTFEKLYGAGLTSLDTLFLAKKEDLAAATGIPLWLCERICNKFQEYREELEGTPRDVAQSGYRTKLAELVTDLRNHHEGFERASAQEWSNPALAADKRKFRQNRQACVLQINVVLAEMGELDLVNEIQKLSFERRIQRLEEYLESTAGMM